jgi:hypothetical protein
MSNIESAILFLSTALGENNDENLSCTWKNINLRTVLGQMYDKYDAFSLQLNYVGQGYVDMGNDPVAPFGLTYNDNLVFIELSGLPLINNTYNIITQHNTNSSIIAVFDIIGSNTNYQTYGNASRVLFGKNSDIINITINLLNNTLSPPAAIHEYPEMCYSFNIFGIPKEEGNLNNTRMTR